MTVLRAAWLAGLLWLAACAAPPVPRDSTPMAGGRLLAPLDGDLAAHARAVVERVRGAEVVYLGEVHDNPHHHAIQARVLQALLDAGVRPSVALEMLPEEDQEVLDHALATPAPPAEVERRLRWEARGWPDFGMYWPILDRAQRYRLPVAATDLAPATTRLVARSGLASLGAEGERLGSLLAPDAGREAAIARAIQEGHCGLLPEARLPRMVESWHARNVTIARRLVVALGRATPVVVIIGRGHQEPGGVPAQLAALRPGTRQLVVELREVASGEAPEAAARGATADVVWLTPAVERPDPCVPLRRRLQGQLSRRP